MNIKLPGDEAWSRVTIDTARADMDRTARDESTNLLKRLRSKPTAAWPRERLAAPASTTAATPSTRAATTEQRPASTQDAKASAPCGPRPRSAWALRDRGPV